LSIGLKQAKERDDEEMQNEKLQKILDVLNNNEELKEKYRRASTEEEKAAVLSAFIGKPSLGFEEIKDKELENVSGGLVGSPTLYVAVCPTCNWRSGYGMPENCFAFGANHVANSDGCKSFKIVAA
jgi:bacteriocin-like protein